MSAKVQKIVTLHPDELLAFCGQNDRRLKKIQDRLKARIVARGNELRLSGAAADVEAADRIIQGLLRAQRSGGPEITDRQLHHALPRPGAAASGGEDPGEEPEAVPAAGELLTNLIPLPNRRLRLTPLTEAQKTYIDAIRRHDVVFCIGPAGTGKTYLAMAMAVHHLMESRVNRLILVRPVVEAGERLGFLPGDITQKVNPYVRPLYDALHEMMDPDQIRELIENGTIEIAPLAYMRGRTLNNSFVILDEAQNTTIEQMKMFITRMGFGSKVVVTGDVTQVDLPSTRPSGLAHVQKVLARVPEIAFVHFTRKDVVRNDLVMKIIHAYEALPKK